jgi:beta-N-acetylhexosaminidase
MTSWAFYPALDASRPAGLSSKIIQGELRDRLGFRGVTITDAIEAGALQRFGGIKTRSILAARAGMDVLLYSARDPGEGTKGLDALASALGNGRLSRMAFQASVERVLDLRTRLGTSPSQPLSGPPAN